jgi:flavin-binding protein dodecin
VRATGFGSQIAGWVIRWSISPRINRVATRRFFPQYEKGAVLSVYKIVELVGTSPTSWEEAASSAVAAASTSLRDLRIAQVSDLDMQIEEGNVVAYRAKVKVSFKHEGAG